MKTVIVEVTTLLFGIAAVEAEDDETVENVRQRVVKDIRAGEIMPQSEDTEVKIDRAWVAGTPCTAVPQRGYRWCHQHSASVPDGESRCYRSQEVERLLGIESSNEGMASTKAGSGGER